MTSKKSRILMSLGTSVLALSLITSSLVGGTFAKYTSTVAGSDSARVAKFNFTVKDQENNTLKKDGTTTINLFDTVYDDGVYGDSSSHNVNPEKLVAPGVEGKFGLKVDNLSEVAVKANLTITETTADGATPNTEVPIIYAYTDADKKTTFWSDIIAKDTKYVLLHALPNGTKAEDLAAGSSAELDTAAFNNAKDGKAMVTISGSLKELADKVNGDPATQLAPSNGTAPETLDLSTRFSWFWAYEIYTQKVDAGLTTYIPDTRDDLDTGLVWNASSNTAAATIPEIKVKIDVNITQMDSYTAPGTP